MSDHESLRAALVHRKIPEMVLSDGGPDSKSGPPAPVPDNLDAAGRAQRRFAIDGNAVVTGGAGNLAIEAAGALLEHGLQGLALFDINPAQAETSIEKLRANFPQRKIITKKVDVANVENVEQAVTETVAELGSIDILCNFAGVVGTTHVEDITMKEWRRVIDINMTGSFLCAQAIGKRMITRGLGGSIIFIASISGHSVNFPQPQVHYNASKAGVIHMARSFAAEWARHGIRCNTISPGYMDTILNEGKSLEKLRNIWKARTPLGRMGQPSELCGPLVLLASQAGSYITGADIIVDGGMSVF